MNHPPPQGGRGRRSLPFIIQPKLSVRFPIRKFYKVFIADRDAIMSVYISEFKIMYIIDYKAK